MWLSTKETERKSAVSKGKEVPHSAFLLRVNTQKLVYKFLNIDLIEVPF
jgi:hypothetical protein